MAGERNRAEFVLGFDGDDGGVAAIFRKLKGQVRTEVQEIERLTNNVELFKTAEAKLKETSAAFFKARDAADSLRQQIQKLESVGADVGKDLREALRLTERQVATTSREYNKQATTLDKLRGSLSAAGVDTRNLAAAEERLAQAARAAAQAEAERQARAALSVKSTKEIAAENSRLVAAYNLLRASGTATYADLQRAAAGLRERQAELHESTQGIGARFSTLRASALGYAAALGVVVAALKSATDASREYEQQLSKVGTVSNVTDEELRSLGEGVRGLSTTLGFDLKEGLDAVYALLRQGVPAGNVLEVLATADDAAKAAVTELGVAAKLSGVLIQAFGVGVNDLKPTLDALFAAMQNGGATFDELASGLGSLAPLARATKTPVEEIAAAIQVMVRAGLDGPEAIGELARLLTRLADPKVRRNLADMGIETKGLVDTLRAIGERGLALDELIGLELSSKKAAGGIAALTADSTRLTSAMDAIGRSAGSIDRVAENVGKIRAEAVAQLVASLDDLLITLGEIVQPSAESIQFLSQLVRTVTSLSKALRDAQGSFGGFLGFLERSNEFNKYINVLGLLGKAIEFLGRASAATNKDLAATATQAEATAASVGDAEQAVAAANAASMQAARQRLAELRGELKAAIPELQAAAKVLQGLAGEAIAAINSEAATRIAGLDKLTASERDNAKQLIAIQQQAAAARLEVITKAAADVLKVVETEAAARRTAAGKSKEELGKVELEIANAKKGVLASIVQAYQAHVDQLTGIQTGHLNKIRELEQQRADVSRSVEDTIRGIRLSGLGEYEKFNATIQEIDRSTSLARQALARGDFEAADKFAKESINLAAGIAKKVESDGRVIVSQFQAQELAIGKIRDAESVLKGTLDERIKAERAGAEATKVNLDTSTAKLADYKALLDDVNRTIAAGVAFDVKVNTDSVKAAQAEIDNLKLPTSSTHTVYLDTVERNASGGVVGRTRGTSPLVEAVRRFASGGPVFRRPNWRKVPGTGNGDTVPATLQAGSYVVRKSASQYYGDGIMGRLARGYQTGGPVGHALQRFASGGKVQESPFFGDIKGGSRESVRDVGEIGAPTLPEDPEALRRLVLQYAADVASAARLDDGRFWARSLEFLANDLTKYERSPTPKKLEAVLRRARGIGLNLGISRGEHTGFDVDGRKWHKAGTARGPDGLAGLGYVWEFYNRGGSAKGTDTVPAMLTPGEWVINRRAVQHFGAGFFERLNSLRLPRANLEQMFEAPRRYATGGEAGKPPAASYAFTPNDAGSSGDSGARKVEVNINANAASLFSRENVRKYIVPEIEDYERRSRK